jgi:dTDP-4-dehydrorhamnose reductase
MKILLLGKNGQVGWELQRSLAVLGEVTAPDHRQRGDWSADLADPEGLAPMVRALRPDVVVNAAAYTAVDKAESEPELAHKVNAESPAVIAREARAIDATLVHYSTDYVFEGSGDTPHDEDAPTAPQCVYGRTKLEGEERIRASGCRHLILRTSWVYAARGSNFARTMLRLALERESLDVVDDQWGAPTAADLLADVTAHALRLMRREPGLGGTYHCVADGVTTWYRYACHVIERARSAGHAVRVPANAIRPVPTRAFPTRSRRPHNSRLDTSRLRTAFQLHLPHWRDGVDRMLTEILDR